MEITFSEMLTEHQCLCQPTEKLFKSFIITTQRQWQNIVQYPFNKILWRKIQTQMEHWVRNKCGRGKQKQQEKTPLKVSQLFFINGYALKIKILLIGAAHATVIILHWTWLTHSLELCTKVSIQQYRADLEEKKYKWPPISPLKKSSACV